MAACSTLSSVAAALLSAPRLLTGAAMAGAVNAAAPASAPAAAIARTSLRILFSPLVSAPLFIFTQFPGTSNGASTKIRLRLPPEGERRLGVSLRGQYGTLSLSHLPGGIAISFRHGRDLDLDGDVGVDGDRGGGSLVAGLPDI